MLNYLKINTINPFSTMFMYIDTSEYHADQIFVDQKLRVKFTKYEFVNNDNGYLCIFVKVPNKKVAVFQECMDELKKKMSLCGRPKYEIEAGEFINTLREACEIEECK